MPDQKVEETPLLTPNFNLERLKSEKKTLTKNKDGLEARLSKIGDILDDKIGSGDGSVKSLLMHIADRWDSQPDRIMMLSRVLGEVAKIQKELHQASTRLHLITSFQKDQGWFAETFLDLEPTIASATDKMMIDIERLLADTTIEPEDIQKD